MDLYQHFRKEEYPFIDQVLSWRDHVTNRYESKVIDFLHPREQRIFDTIIGNDEDLQLKFFGGWEQAERKRAVLAPFYDEVNTDSFEVVLLQATFPQKFVSIEHPDVLGSFLSAGIKRKKIGDIVIYEDTIQILVAEDITTYLIANVTSIKKAGVLFERVPLTKRLPSQDKWQERTTTCASLRLDVLIKEIYQMSRQQALNLIKKGYVKVNFQTIDQQAFLLEDEDLISIRGKGRTRIKEIQGRTKKDKIRITFEKLL
ncbi:RNA-binding protein [Gracilibacillus kekensis]|uniref:RNA-binding protein YlmH, contains S4-like domain n=1 Tax=Gracilibacillus kekensis TaxID=1027249 RepID=A0A1M7PE38_9BACI|nr:YlmH/Sll1252 family protein [Gracilibacillus kekensis]SHN15236.1 RNA-binding protein YlmH, contains S4-like domain [Gracilibacillus kekensis]